MHHFFDFPAKALTNASRIWAFGRDLTYYMIKEDGRCSPNWPNQHKEQPNRLETHRIKDLTFRGFTTPTLHYRAVISLLHLATSFFIIIKPELSNVVQLKQVSSQETHSLIQQALTHAKHYITPQDKVNTRLNPQACAPWKSCWKHTADMHHKKPTTSASCCQHLAYAAEPACSHRSNRSRVWKIIK